MAALEDIDGIQSYIQHAKEVERKTNAQISAELQQTFPTMRGLSQRSVERFCADHKIAATSRLDAQSLSRVVKSAVSEVIIIMII